MLPDKPRQSSQDRAGAESQRGDIVSSAGSGACCGGENVLLGWQPTKEKVHHPPRLAPHLALTGLVLCSAHSLSVINHWEKLVDPEAARKEPSVTKRPKMDLRESLSDLLKHNRYIASAAIGDGSI